MSHTVFGALNPRQKLITTATGFEPVRAEPIGFQVQLLNLSDTLSNCTLQTQRFANKVPHSQKKKQEVSLPGFEPGLSRPQRDVLTARRKRLFARFTVLIRSKSTAPVKQNSGHPESNQGPFDTRTFYSRTLYQLSYSRFERKPHGKR